MEVLFFYYSLHENETQLRVLLNSLCEMNTAPLTRDFVFSLANDNKEKIASHLSKKPWAQWDNTGLRSWVSQVMTTKYRVEHSFNGLRLDVLKSALQKYIRRAITSKALYSAVELDLFAYGDGGEKFRTNFIHRLMINYLEEISVAVPNAWQNIDNTVFEGLLVLRDKRRTYTEYSTEWVFVRHQEMRNIVTAVLLMSTLPHARVLSHCGTVFSPALVPVFNSIYPPYKVWLETPFKSEIVVQGVVLESEVIQKQVACFLGALEQKDDRAYFWARKIEANQNLVNRYYRCTKPGYLVFAALEAYILKSPDKMELMKYHKLGLKWYKEIDTPEKVLCYGFLVILITRDVMSVPFTLPNITMETMIETYGKNLSGESIIIDPYVIDMHTREGKAKGNDAVTFAKEGSYVANESPVVVKEYKDLYNLMKYHKEEMMVQAAKEGLPSIESVMEAIMNRVKDTAKNYKETDVYELVSRAQLVCSDSRQDTYFALSKKDGLLYFVKGPYVDKDDVMIPIRIADLKKKLGLSYMEYKVEQLIPDMFDVHPVGLRNKLDLTKSYSFLVTRAMLPIHYPQKIHSSKKWPPTKVVDWDNETLKKYISPIDAQLPSNLMSVYIDNLFFRFIVGIPDPANRNFIVTRGTIYAVDEENYGQNVKFAHQLGKDMIERIKRYIIGMDNITQKLQRWRQIFQDETHFSNKDINGMLERIDEVIIDPSALFSR